VIDPKSDEWDEILLEQFNDLAQEYGVKGIILNCCYVGTSALEKLTSPEWVLAFKTPVVGGSTAIEFAKRFYSVFDNNPKARFQSMPTAKQGRNCRCCHLY
jgi:hypothetical protein